ncbi:MAG: hypothetical protein PVH19_14680 [Planctomycetia bacterium]|jgi:hypothetical protein
MLIAKPRHWFSWCFHILDEEGNLLTDISQHWFREQGEFSIGEYTFQLQRDSMWDGLFSLRENDSVLVSAQKTSMFLRSFEVQIGNTFYTLKAENAFTRKFVLRDQEGRYWGEVRPKHPFTRRSEISFSNEFPVAIRVFLFWLALILWRRAENND